jgi:Raf kinase inhibitor-like YbhB/YbcL family protein
MKTIPLACGLVVLLTGFVFAQQPGAKRAPAGPGLTITSPAFEDGGIIPDKFTQQVAAPISPKLEWAHAPAGTVSFVLLMRDPDTAPQKKVVDILHWLVLNIPGSAKELPEAVPADAKLADGSVQLKNFRGAVGYLGPGAGAAGPYHHYTWELFALDTKLDLTADATRADVLNAMDGHILGKGALMGRFHRK